MSANFVLSLIRSYKCHFLPVNSYRPMDFVLIRLSISAILPVLKKVMTGLKFFQEIVEFLSGQESTFDKTANKHFHFFLCISQCGKEDKKRLCQYFAGRIANFAIVAIQVCHPKIYKMLALMPNFLKMGFCNKHKNEPPHSKTRMKKKSRLGRDILEVACAEDSYLFNATNDIRNLLYLIQSTVDIDSNGGNLI